MGKFIVQLDRDNYRKRAQLMSDLGGVEGSTSINTKTQSFIKTALGKFNGEIHSTRGDDALILFEKGEDAHNFALEVHELTRKDNKDKTENGKCWFTIGCAFGQGIIDDKNPTGTEFTTVAELHKKAGPGEILLDTQAYINMPFNIQAQYGKLETVISDSITFKVHRLVVVDSIENPAKKVILILNDISENTLTLRLTKEIERISNSTSRGGENSEIRVYEEFSNFPDELNKIRPYIIHTSEYINEIKDKILGNIEYIVYPETQIGSVFEPSKKYIQRLECVILYGSYSDEEIRDISQHINFVIRASENLGEKYYLSFLDEFYYRIAASLDVRDSYNLGCKHAHNMENPIDENHKPKLFTKVDEIKRRELENELDKCIKDAEQNPKSAKSWKQRGDLLVKLGRQDEANNAYDRASELDGTDYKVWWRKAQVLTQQKKYPQATESYERALKLLVSSPPSEDEYMICRDYAVALNAFGKFRKSIALYKKSLQLQPNYRISNYEKNKIYQKIL